MKKLINDVARIVPQMLEGVVRLNPDLALLEGETVVIDAASAEARKAGRVALISGGGAGHEPAHAGYVGDGMLSAAVSGDVFTSPSTDAVLAAIRAVAGPAGVLLIVKNYTGDRLNFGLAAEIANAEGIPAEMVIVADDVALADTAAVGRRGIAGTVFVHKIAGAVAAAGGSLAEVKAAAEFAADVGTMGVALTPCIVPAADSPGFTLGDDEIELGLGIHGEAGIRRSSIEPADRLVDEIINVIVADKGLASGDRVALMVNNLGGTPSMEMAILARRAHENLGRRGIVTERAWAGTFLTALEMAGFSISVLKVDDAAIRSLDAPTRAMAWPGPTTGRAAEPKVVAAPKVAVKTGSAATPLAAEIRRAIEKVAATLTAAESELTRLDQIVGDGDLGISLARGSAAVLAEMGGYDLDRPAETLRALSGTLRRALGGTSGPVYAVLLMRMAAVLEGRASPTVADWAKALGEGCGAVSAIGGAQEGDRTVLDALLPAVRALKSTGDLKAAVSAAEEGCAATAKIAARRGRASYLGDRAVGHVDPGARAVVIWLSALAD
ncbi:dihydroxyacetone kinase subunit DhaL [Rhizobium terrae]|uniref:dihydroxyacetone kinase subunit DhaL n=1 Tax=Rhizobium terrae TaxID=2171756 RepID=UPI000E3BABE4|nr:dihydroxyacetone kinase subunit DhaL [Rhizobium terrae]